MNRKVSKYQALLRYYPERPWSSEFGTFRTSKVVGRALGEEYDPIREAIAKLIEPDYARKSDRESRMRRSRALRIAGVERRQRGSEGGPGHVETTEADEAAAAAFLDAIRSPTPGAFPAEHPPGAAGRRALPPEAIDLRIIDDETDIQAEVFPLFFLCEVCHRYYFLDPNGEQSLKCPEHGGNTELHQLSVVFACARCANVEPLLPHSVQQRRLASGWVRCPRGHGVYLDLSKNMANARWRCEDPNCDSGINGRVSRWCALCDVSDETLRNRETRSVMAPRSAIGGDIMSPLTATYVRDSQGNPIELARLRRQHRDVEGSFTLATIEPTARRRLDHLGVREFFDVPNVQSILVTYGYRSLVRPRPDVPDRERYGRFFQPQPRVERFKAYLGVTEGRGMIMGFNTDELIAIAPPGLDGPARYSDRVAQEMLQLGQIDFQDLIAATDQPALFPMTKVLHTLEHGLRQSLASVIGLTDFDSRIIVADGAILLFETRDLGDGGIRQLGRHSGLMASWTERVIRKLNECPQLCESACIACVKPDNTSCHGFLTGEFARWMPPNILLDRRLAMDWLRRNAGT